MCLQKLIDGMRSLIPSLTFTIDAFSRGLVDPDTVELVLRDVPLPADEVDVCRALSKWAEAYDGDTDRPGDGFIPVDDNIMRHIDLMFVSLHDTTEVRKLAMQLSCFVC